jgi:hypothetical protein
MKKPLFITFVSIISLFYSCTEELTTSTDVLSMTPVNSTQSLQINASSSWIAKSSNSWVTMSDSTGKGNKNIVLVCKDNITGVARTATISIQEGNQSKTVIINQGGGDLVLNEHFNDNTGNWTFTFDSIKNSINNSFFDIKSVAKRLSYNIDNKPLNTQYLGNYMISIDYKMIWGTAPFGLTFGDIDSNNLYRILIYQSGGIVVAQSLNGIYSTVLSTSITNYKNENTVNLVKVGTICTVYFNGLNVGTFTLSSPYGSYVGFVSCPQTEVLVDYLKINQY